MSWSSPSGRFGAFGTEAVTRIVAIDPPPLTFELVRRPTAGGIAVMTFDMPVARTIVLVFDAADDLPPFVGGIVIRILIGRLID